MLRASFKRPLRQAEGLIDSVLTLMKLTISVPDHTTVGLTVVAFASVPKGPLHILIDSTGPAGLWCRAMVGGQA